MSDSLPRTTTTKLNARLLSIPYPRYQVAALAGIHPSTLSSYAKGHRDMLPKHLMALCKTLNCEPEDIIGYVTIGGEEDD